MTTKMEARCERERGKEKTESKKERNLHQCCRRGCHIIIITITITLPEGFIYHQLQLIRLLLRLATVDLYLDIYSFIHLLTSLIVWYVYLVLFIHFDRCTDDKDVTNEMRESKTTTGVAVCYIALLRNKKNCVRVLCLLLVKRKRYKLLKIHTMSVVLETINV
jgi:hypothetical protein